MGDKKCIIVRHGDYDKVMYGDGPLTQNGRITVSATAIRLREKLKEMKISWVDLAIVSGAIRCQSTYAVIAESFFEKGIMIERTVIEQKYFATHEEKREWKRVLSDKQFYEECESLGEREAVMNHLRKEVIACVDRINTSITRAWHENTKVILVVTHGPHDAILAEKLKNKDYEGLEKGRGRIIVISDKTY